MSLLNLLPMKLMCQIEIEIQYEEVKKPYSSISGRRYADPQKREA